MEEITQQYIKEVVIDSNSETVLLKTSGGSTIGLNLEEFLKSHFEKKIIKLVEPSNDNNSFIMLDGKDYEVWKY